MGRSPSTKRDRAPGSKDTDVGDLTRGRGADTSLHPEGLVPVAGQPRSMEKSFDLLLVEPKPGIGKFLPHPGVGVLHLISDDDRSARLHDPNHLPQHCFGILGVMEHYVGECRVDAAAGEWQCRYLPQE